MIDWSIRVGDILVVLSLAGALLAQATRFTGSLSNMQKDLDRMTKANEEFSKAMTVVAVQQEQIKNLGSQVTLLARQVDDMRHGQGFVMKVAERPGESPPYPPFPLR